MHDELKERLQPLIDEMKGIGLKALTIVHDELGKVIEKKDFEKAQRLLFVLGRFGDLYQNMSFGLEVKVGFDLDQDDEYGDDDENESAVVGFDIPPNAHFATTEPSVEYAKPSVDKN